jgi:hypothetical protein
MDELEALDPEGDRIGACMRARTSG